MNLAHIFSGSGIFFIIGGLITIVSAFLFSENKRTPRTLALIGGLVSLIAGVWATAD